MRVDAGRCLATRRLPGRSATAPQPWAYGSDAPWLWHLGMPTFIATSSRPRPPATFAVDVGQVGGSSAGQYALPALPVGHAIQALATGTGFAVRRTGRCHPGPNDLVGRTVCSPTGRRRAGPRHPVPGHGERRFPMTDLFPRPARQPDREQLGQPVVARRRPGAWHPARRQLQALAAATSSRLLAEAGRRLSD